MLNLGKLPIFKGKSETLGGCLHIADNDIPFTISEVPAAARPEGFRFSKYISVLKADGAGFSVQGAGESRSSISEAFEKAKSEALERLSLQIHCAQNQIQDTSSGWAAHTNFSAAKTSAALELFERDAILVQWFRAASLVEVDPTQLPFQIKWWKWSELALSEFPKLSILITTEGFYPAVVALLANARGNGIIGAASSTDLKTAIDSAIAEVCRSAHHVIRGTFVDETDSIHQGKTLSVKPGAHSVLYAKSHQLPEWLINSRGKIEWQQVNEMFQASNLEDAILSAAVKFQEIANGDRIVLKADSDRLQKIFWGCVEEKHLNFERIKRNLNSINQLPHLVG